MSVPLPSCHTTSSEWLSQTACSLELLHTSGPFAHALTSCTTPRSCHSSCQTPKSVVAHPVDLLTSLPYSSSNGENPEEPPYKRTVGRGLTYPSLSLPLLHAVFRNMLLRVWLKRSTTSAGGMGPMGWCEAFHY